VHLIDGLTGQIIKTLSRQAPVIATGGLAGVIARRTNTIEHIEPDLCLEGILIIYEKNRDRIGKQRSI
jgi:type III pantothenate kinase